MAMRSTDVAPALSASEQVSLCEALDRVLNKGAVVLGELTITVADIDLIYLGLQVVLTSIETGRRLAAGTLTPTLSLRRERETVLNPRPWRERGEGEGGVREARDGRQ